MKKLTRVKLINWHRFVNATIDLEKSTLISGENGAGKSTLMKVLSGIYPDKEYEGKQLF